MIVVWSEAEGAAAARAGVKVLSLTQHPLQRAGARTAAVLAGRDRPDDVTVTDLDGVAAAIVADVVRAAVADRESPSYDWWKVLYALFPNSKPTHAGRSRDATVLTPEVQQFFALDQADAALRPCTFCGSATAVLWSKSMLPMFDARMYPNTLPPRTAGWPVCRGCRVALWAMPYGAAVTVGGATVLTCDDDAVERSFAATNCERTARIRRVGFTSAAGASAEAVALRALRERAASGGNPVTTTLWAFKTDNREPWLRVTQTRLAVVNFLRALPAETEADRGWLRLQRTATKGSAEGAVVQDGRDVVAKMLFEPANQCRDKLLSELSARGEAVEKLSGRALRDWRALYALYLKEMCGMDPGVLKPVTELLVEWITAEKNPRGRFNDYRRVAGRTFQLQDLLMEAVARLLLDGRRPPDITDVTGLLFAPTSEGRHLRGQLFFEVATGLVARDARIGTRVKDDTDAERDGPLVGFDPFDDEDGAYT
jgi:CRISPR-associated protein Cst1